MSGPYGNGRSGRGDGLQPGYNTPFGRGGPPPDQPSQPRPGQGGQNRGPWEPDTRGQHYARSTVPAPESQYPGSYGQFREGMRIRADPQHPEQIKDPFSHGGTEESEMTTNALSMVARQHAMDSHFRPQVLAMNRNANDLGTTTGDSSYAPGASRIQEATDPRYPAQSSRQGVQARQGLDPSASRYRDYPGFPRTDGATGQPTDVPSRYGQMTDPSDPSGSGGAGGSSSRGRLSRGGDGRGPTYDDGRGGKYSTRASRHDIQRGNPNPRHKYTTRDGRTRSVGPHMRPDMMPPPPPLPPKGTGGMGRYQGGGGEHGAPPPEERLFFR